MGFFDKKVTTNVNQTDYNDYNEVGVDGSGNTAVGSGGSLSDSSIKTKAAAGALVPTQIFNLGIPGLGQYSQPLGNYYANSGGNGSPDPFGDLYDLGSQYNSVPAANAGGNSNAPGGGAGEDNGLSVVAPTLSDSSGIFAPNTGPAATGDNSTATQLTGGGSLASGFNSTAANAGGSALLGDDGTAASGIGSAISSGLNSTNQVNTISGEGNSLTINDVSADIVDNALTSINSGFNELIATTRAGQAAAYDLSKSALAAVADNRRDPTEKTNANALQTVAAIVGIIAAAFVLGPKLKSP